MSSEQPVACFSFSIRIKKNSAYHIYSQEMAHSSLLSSVRFVQGIMGRFPASFQTNNGKQLEKGRGVSQVFIVHEQLCQGF